MLDVLFSMPYESVKDSCLLMKTDRECGQRWARLIIGCLPEKSILIAIPNHNGEVANGIYSLCSALEHLADEQNKSATFICLFNRDSGLPLSEYKQSGRPIPNGGIGLSIRYGGDKRWVKEHYEDGYVPILVDDFIDTGLTMRTAQNLVGLPCKCIAIGQTNI